MLSATLDTSCALNFLGEDDEVSDALVDLVAAAMAGRVNLRVTEQAYAEIARARDAGRRRERLKRLRMFGRVELAPHRCEERDRRALQLQKVLFPSAKSGSRTSDHNRRDCLQLATHELVGRDLFVTRDVKLYKRVHAHSSLGIEVANPQELLARISIERRAGALPNAPAIAVRDADPDQDEAAIREILEPLSQDYPDFGGWLNRALERFGMGRVRIRVGLAEQRVGAVALSTKKDERVVKLSAFYVADWARAAGLGQHLLWSEVRSWAQADVEKVYVTVSSRHGDLVEFFQIFGFLIEGVAARRYQDDTSEIVLGKHLVRRLYTDDDLHEFSNNTAKAVFSSPDSVAPNPSTWALAPQAAHPTLGWAGEGAGKRLEALHNDEPLRSWSLLELETIFHPARLHLAGRDALIVPIRPEWADAMLDYPDQQLALTPADEGSEKLLLRADNAYYCYPTALSTAVTGTPILFLVTGGVGIVGEARIFDAVVDTPEELYARLGGLGIYGIQQIRGHARKRGQITGKTLGMRFGSYVPFEKPVTRDRMGKALARDLQVQTITPIRGHEFEELRRIGGLTW